MEDHSNMSAGEALMTPLVEDAPAVRRQARCTKWQDFAWIGATALGAVLVLAVIVLATPAKQATGDNSSLFEVSFAAAQDQFGEFKARYGKAYASEEEHAARLQHFQRNLERIERLNAQGGGATYGVDRFSDLSPDEFRAQYLLPKANPSDVCKFPFHQRNADHGPGDAPATVDWRDKGAVTPVKNQGQCGSCWAFSATGVVEGQFFLKTNKLVSLAEQNLVDCSHACLGSMRSICDSGCRGGLPWLAYDYIKASGITDEAGYPYSGVADSCFIMGDIVTKISSWEGLPSDPRQIEAYLAQHGPVSIAMNADLLMQYKSGVIDNADMNQCTPLGIDHAVLLVGYGTENGKNYWIVKNSWDTTWGENGFFRIASDKGLCGINACASSVTI